MELKRYAWSLLILRLVLGFNFALHGFAKFGGGIENTSRWFDSLGLPGILAYGVALLEVLGGFGLMAGLFTRFLSALYMIVMFVAISKVQFSRGYLGGWELETTFFALASALLVAGGGLYSVDHALFPSKKILRILRAKEKGARQAEEPDGQTGQAVEA
jgi:uncharacterized membrane protein YphA (DoxX/SURF4 family)